MALDGSVVRCFFVCSCVWLESLAPAPVLRFLDLFSLFGMAPTEPKYESIGSSPDMYEFEPMEVHNQRCFERAIEPEAIQFQEAERSLAPRRVNASRFSDSMILPNYINTPSRHVYLILLVERSGIAYFYGPRWP